MHGGSSGVGIGLCDGFVETVKHSEKNLFWGFPIGDFWRIFKREFTGGILWQFFFSLSSRTCHARARAETERKFCPANWPTNLKFSEYSDNFVNCRKCSHNSYNLTYCRAILNIVLTVPIFATIYNKEETDTI